MKKQIIILIFSVISYTSFSFRKLEGPYVINESADKT